MKKPLAERARDYAVAALVVGLSFDWIFWIRVRAARILARVRGA